MELIQIRTYELQIIYISDEISSAHNEKHFFIYMKERDGFQLLMMDSLTYYLAYSRARSDLFEPVNPTRDLTL